MLVITRDDLARNLFAYGERAASERVPLMSQDDYTRVCEIGFRHALTGMALLKAGCLAAIEVLEGKPRELSRKRRVLPAAAAKSVEDDAEYARLVAEHGPYLGGMPLKIQQVANQLGDSLSSLLPDFKYQKTKRRFYKPIRDGYCYLQFEFSRYSIALRFGVSHERIAKLWENLFDFEYNTVHFVAQISQYSLNMGPDSWHWPYRICPHWIIPRSEGVRRVSDEMAAFIKEIVLPYLVRHEDPALIRDTMLHQPGHADGSEASRRRTVFAIDHLLRRRDWLEQDHHALREQHLARVAAEAAKADRPPLGLGNVPHPGIIVAFHRVRAPAPDPLDVMAEDYQRVVARWDG